MILGIAVIVLCGMAFDWLARRANAPGLIGLLLLGLLAGPFALDLLPGGLYAVASDLRILALVVILFRAGFEMNRKSLAQVGPRAVLLSFVPCVCEALVITCVAPVLLPLYSALITVLTVGVVIYELDIRAAGEISEKLAKVWVFAQLLLFVLVGAQVDVRLAWSAGGAGAAVVIAGLAGRSIGVFLCLLRSELTHRERLFVVFAYVPKATVQAAIGATPLAAMTAAGMDGAPGQLILAVAVLSILLTAPLGAFLIGLGGKRLLSVQTVVSPHRAAPVC